MGEVSAFLHEGRAFLTGFFKHFPKCAPSCAVLILLLSTRNGPYSRSCQVAMATKVSVGVQDSEVEILLLHQLSTSNSYVLLQTSTPFIKFSRHVKWKAVSKRLTICNLAGKYENITCFTPFKPLLVHLFTSLRFTFYLLCNLYFYNIERTAHVIKLSLNNGSSKKERGQRQRMQKGADCDIV